MSPSVSGSGRSQGPPLLMVSKSTRPGSLPAKPESGLTALGGGAFTSGLVSSLLSGTWDLVPGKNPQTLSSGVTVPVLTALLQGFSQNLGEASTYSLQFQADGLDDRSYPKSNREHGGGRQ